MLTPSSWSHPPTALQLGIGEVHVWRAYLPAHLPRLAALANHLSANEQGKASRFYFARDRERYTLARGLLRELLHLYLAIAPNHLRFSYGAHGKPALAVPADGQWIRFNLSHAHDLTLYAFARDQEPGIDIERIRPDFAYEQIARRVFSPYEIATLFDLPDPTRIEAFFRGWTIKEAYIKALGGGLSIPLDQFDVALTPGTPAAILATRPDAAEASRWTVRRLDPGSGYEAALAVRGSVSKLMCWQVDSATSV